MASFAVQGELTVGELTSGFSGVWRGGGREAAALLYEPRVQPCLLPLPPGIDFWQRFPGVLSPGIDFWQRFSGVYELTFGNALQVSGVGGGGKRRLSSTSLASSHASSAFHRPHSPLGSRRLTHEVSLTLPVLNPTPCSQHPAPYSLHPTTYTLHPAFYVLTAPSGPHSLHRW